MSKKKIPNFTIKDIYLGKASFDGKTGEYLAAELLQKIYEIKIDMRYTLTINTMTLSKDGVTVYRSYPVEKLDENGMMLKKYETFCSLEKELEDALKEKAARDEMAEIAREVVEEHEDKKHNTIIHDAPECKQKKKHWFF